MVAMDRSSKAAGRVLLPSHVIPERYDLSLEPDLVAFTFTGVVEITFAIDKSKITDENAKTITLHTHELCFSRASLCSSSNNGGEASIPAEEIRQNLKSKTVQFVFEKPLTDIDESSIKLKVEYIGFLNNQMAGFYRSHYTDIDGNKKVMASTQFEALDARRALPCVDEPSAKAIFSVTMTIPSHLHCFSNMPLSSKVSISREKNKYTFLDSPRMSTYLLAFCVGEFDSVQAATKSGVMVQVYTPPGKSTHGTFALDAAVRALDAFDAFFGTHYPLPKLDMVAISEFAMGAMENWGLVTYREVDLLVDPVTASNSQKQRVAIVVAHELSHQWFGNLVTMAWWDDLWLNEGFASWAENWAIDLLYPDYAMWDQFTTDHLSSALSLDSLKSSHPIQVPIGHAEEVEQVFDAISYCKGGSVVRMIQSVLGMKNFQKGLAAYMKKHAYSNTETFDLWAALEEASGMPVGEMMASWTEQMGFPFLHIVSEDWQADKVTFELEQKWFLADGSELNEEDTAKTWTVPILTCTSAGQQEDMTLMREKTASITIPLNGADDWAKLNAGHGAPIRVLSSEEMLKRLSKPIQTKTLPAIDRAGLLSDAYAMVKAGHMSPDALIQLVGNYKDEDNYVVWDALSGVLSGLDKVLSDNPTLWAYFKNFARGFVLALKDKVGWDISDSDGHLTTLLRSTMVDLLSVFAHDDPAVVKEATTRFRAFQQDHNDVKSLPSGIRTSVFKIFIKNGGAKEYEEVKSYYQAAETNSEKNRVLSSLGSTEDVKLKLATMEWSTSGEIKLQDFFYPMGSVGRSSREGREISWKYMQDNFDKIKAMLVGASPSLMDTVIVMCAGGFCSREKADEIEAFFKENPLPNNTRTIAQMLESMRTNAKFMDTLVASALSKEDFWTSL